MQLPVQSRKVEVRNGTSGNEASVDKKRKIAEGLNRVMGEKNDSFTKLIAIADMANKLCDEERGLHGY